MLGRLFVAAVLIGLAFWYALRPPEPPPLLISAAAPEPVGEYGRRESSADTPERFRRDLSNIRIYTLSTQEQIEAVCGRSSRPDRHRAACIRGQRADPQVYIPNPCHPQFAGENLAWRLCHELGHAQGWTGDHEP